jgi:hypothetical protein
VDPRVGFIHEASFLNTHGPDPVEWGLTSDDEMMVLGLQYILGDDITSVKDIEKEVSMLKVYPNPAHQSFTLTGKMTTQGKLRIELFDVIAERVRVLADEQTDAGSFSKRFSTEGLSPGIYFIRTIRGTDISTQKIVISE